MLKLKRILEWWEVLDQERVTQRTGVFLRAFWKMGRGALGPKVAREVWRRRMRVCFHCPIFDRTMKRCRPYAKSQLGCGCYMPYLCSVARPYPKGCWAKEVMPNRGFGWPAEEVARG